MNGQKNQYEGCEFEFTDDGIVQVLCENPGQRQALLELITGKDLETGVCMLDNSDTSKKPEEYKKRVDMIDPDKIVSTLNVRNYLIFFAMVAGIYHDGSAEEIIRLFEQSNMEKLLERPMNELSREERLKVRCMASRLKEVKCLVGKDMLEDMESGQVDEMLQFLKNHICKSKCVCLLFENKELSQSAIKEIYRI